ncbi:MAG TPA: flagellar biosynthetic protein FliR [Bryobacteraceae bacterium]|nr:flagellar biosynthetic protein FliR [Bryobacteraceae bacterium]
MPAELQIPLGWPLAFVLVLTRMAGAFVFVPMPVKDAGPGIARIVFALATAVALFPRWPVIDSSHVTLGVMAVWLFSEAAFGLSIGLVTSFLAEALTMGAQILGLQAGYGYASVVDPTTAADSDVLQVLAQLTSGLLFFSLGLHRWVIRAFALSLDRYPPGQFTLNRSLAETVTLLGSNIFVVGLRLALPIVGLLAMTEIALALVGRLNPQLHIGSSSAALKLLLTLATLTTVLKVVPNLYQSYAGQLFGALRRALFE